MSKHEMHDDGPGSMPVGTVHYEHWSGKLWRREKYHWTPVGETRIYFYQDRKPYHDIHRFPETALLPVGTVRYTPGWYFDDRFVRITREGIEEL